MTTRTTRIALTCVMALTITATSASALTGTDRISTAGLGPIKLSMTEQQVEHATKRSVTLSPAPGSDCAIATLAPKTRGLFIAKRLRRIYINTSRFATKADIRVGSTERKVLAAYPGQLARVPQKYVSAEDDLVLPKGTSNTKIIFSLAHGKVAQISTGRIPEINLVEGCA